MGTSATGKTITTVRQLDPQHDLVSPYPQLDLKFQRIELTKDHILQSWKNHIQLSQGKDANSITPLDAYMAAALVVRDYILNRWSDHQQRHYRRIRKHIHFISLEYHLGRLLEVALLNLGIREEMSDALAEIGLDLDDVASVEWEPGLGLTGVGRFAACFLDSLATLGVPVTAHGIRYEYGLFRQKILDGRQAEFPDNWLRYGFPWEIPRPDALFSVQYYGHVRQGTERQDGATPEWVDTSRVGAMAYDVLIPGFRNTLTNTIRLWSAKSFRELDFSYFNRGDYISALQERNSTETITRVLYPNETFDVGRELRLKQEFFLTSAALQDALHRHAKDGFDVASLTERAIFHFNNMLPALGVAELMRILLDEHSIHWDQAWHITTHSIAWTSHLPISDELARWDASLFARLLPRHTEIITEIDRRSLQMIRAMFPNDEERAIRMSVFDRTLDPHVRAGNLSVLASYSINGISSMHSRFLRERVFADFYNASPGQFVSTPGGVSHRHWLLKSNPSLAKLISINIGDGWMLVPRRLSDLEPFSESEDFRQEWNAVRRSNKERLARRLLDTEDVKIDPRSLFDVHATPFEAHKRQLMTILHVLTLYLQYQRAVPHDAIPMTFLFAGKCKIHSELDKLLVRLICAVSKKVEDSREVADVLRVAFVPNYGISQAEELVGAADISEHLSVPGTAAGPTSNMKFGFNGVALVGSNDGTNVDILEAVGKDNFFSFGPRVDDLTLHRTRDDDPKSVLAQLPLLSDAIRYIESGELLPSEPALFQPLFTSLWQTADRYRVVVDFQSYSESKERAVTRYRSTQDWTEMSIRITSRMGRFSSDYVASEYCRSIWKVESDV